MAERPIIFSAPMVRAILAGRKTQTRRIVKVQGVMGGRYPITALEERPIELEPGEFAKGIFHYESTSALSGPYKIGFAVGDLLWVREAFYLTDDGHNEYPVFAADEEAAARHINGIGNLAARYGFSNDWLAPHVKKRPPIHMPRWASRITLKVTGVKVERLQDISEADAEAEGADPFTGALQSYRTSFYNIWERINGPGSWDANPWVAAISFERLPPPPAGERG